MGLQRNGDDQFFQSQHRRDMRWVVVSSLMLALSTACAILTSTGMPGHVLWSVSRIPIVIVACISAVTLAASSAKVIWTKKDAGKK